jgi:hypothetical protein
MTIGASRRCDWQIASPGVDPLSIAFTGDSLLVRISRQDERVRLNGEVLSLGWVELAHGDVLDVGPSSLAVHLAVGMRRRQRGSESRGRSKGRRKAKREARAGRWVEQVEAALPGSSIVLHEDVPPGDAPVLFQPRQRSAQMTFVWYAAIALATMLAYAGWVAVLDQL